MRLPDIDPTPAIYSTPQGLQRRPSTRQARGCVKPDWAMHTTPCLCMQKTAHRLRWHASIDCTCASKPSAQVYENQLIIKTVVLNDSASSDKYGVRLAPEAFGLVGMIHGEGNVRMTVDHVPNNVIWRGG